MARLHTSYPEPQSNIRRPIVTVRFEDLKPQHQVALMAQYIILMNLREEIMEECEHPKPDQDELNKLAQAQAKKDLILLFDKAIIA